MRHMHLITRLPLASAAILASDVSGASRPQQRELHHQEGAESWEPKVNVIHFHNVHSSKSGKGWKSSKGDHYAKLVYIPEWEGDRWGHNSWTGPIWTSGYDHPPKSAKVYEAGWDEASKSGKVPKGSKCTDDDEVYSKSGKDWSKSSKDCDNCDGWMYSEHSPPAHHLLESEPQAEPNSSSARGICAPDFHNGGLDCAQHDFETCHAPGTRTGCSSGYKCYPKDLCPQLYGGGNPIIGVCDAHGEGLDCKEVTTYCTDPGWNGECGADRQCHNAGHCGLGDESDHYYFGVCGSHHGELDCGSVSTKCSYVGSKSECANGAECFSAELCYPGDDDTEESTAEEWSDDGHEMEVITTILPDEGDDDGHIVNVDLYPNDICYWKGDFVPCIKGPEGEGVILDYFYSVQTTGLDPESVVSPLELAISKGFADHLTSSGDSSETVTRISTLPKDLIKNDETCSTKHDGVECSVIKGQMTLYADNEGLDACDHSNSVKAVIEGNDFSHIQGVETVEYLRPGSSCDNVAYVVSGRIETEEEDDSLSVGAMIGFALLAALVAALALLAASKLRRKSVDSREFDIISVDTDFAGNRFEAEEDPFASTVDVHKCTSMYCNCNKGGKGTTFIPAPKKANIDKLAKKHALSSSISPTGVHEAQGFFVGDPEPLEDVSMDDEVPPTSDQEKQDEIIRASPNAADRDLAPVREVANDSEIDTEFESDGEDEIESIPPPPPPLPPGKQKASSSRNRIENDEMSI